MMQHNTNTDTAAPDPKVELIRRGYEAVERGDVAALDEMFADDVTWYGLPGSSNERLSRDYDGKAAVFGFFGELGQLSSGSLRREVQDVLANDRWAVAWVRESGEREGKTAEWNELQIFTFTPEGRIADFRGLPFDLTVVDEFWS
jgi:ketosteroid isomerase-like protein